MFTGLGVAETFGQTEINNVYVVLLLANTDKEIVRLDISMQEVSRVHKLNTLEHLVGEHKHCFQREFTLAIVKQVLKTRPQQINHHDIVVTFDAEPVDVRDTDYSNGKNTKVSQISKK